MNRAVAVLVLAAWPCVAPLAGVLPARAQGPGLGPVVLTLPGSTRALGVGNAFVLGAQDSDAIFYNAALTEQLRGFGGAVQWLPQTGAENGRLLTFSGATEWWRGSVALGFQALSYEARGGPAIPGTMPASGAVASAAYSRRILGIRLSATGKLIEQRFLTERAATGAVDIAAALASPILFVGLAVRNLGPDLDLPTPFRADLPERIALSVSTRPRPTGPLDILASAALASDFDGDLTGGIGAEIGYWPIAGRTFLARAGVMRGETGTTRPTLGAGFTGDRILIDYAYADLGGASHRIGLRWR